MSRILHPPTHPICLVFLAVTAVACGEAIPGRDGAAPCQASCADAAVDGTLAAAGKRSPENDDPDASDARRVGIPADSLPPDAPLIAADSAADVAMALPPDVAPVVPPPDAAVDAPLNVPPDAGPPDVAVVVPPDAAPLMPDSAPLLPDTAPLMPDTTPLMPDMAPLMPDTAPLMPDMAPLMPDTMPPGNGCPGTAGPAMIKADLGATPFCIDSSEVTNSQYAAFLAATGDGSQTGNQPAACSWNSSYRPSTDGAPWPYAAGRESRPVVNVDWCDARAYCQWAGKRLCGKIGGGSLVGWAMGAEPPVSQWASACTRAWDRDYPYGDTFSAGKCNLSAPAEGVQYLANVKSYPQCEGGYNGLYDMSGNVEEWVDACDKSTGATDGCASAGTSAFLDGLTPAEITCADSLYSTPRNTRWVMLGFRCCADL